MSTKNLNQFLISILILFCNAGIHAQSMVQNIKGVVIDKESKIPLPGATVYIPDTDPVKGTTTDESGNFRLNNMETGRYKLCVRYVGYEPLCLENLNLTSGKEQVLKLEIEESVTKVDEVVVKAGANKNIPNNSMSVISSRAFTIEESQRYAGARNDVARMASNYAGVAVGNDAQNEIVVRGNSPNGLLWQLEGVEIPNPNHYGSLGATAGPVCMLNNNTLSNSDFMTSAFAADYGNAVSGVFDLSMREGNHDKHEFLGQVGFNGFEVGAEGPISKKNKASYLFNYRYSTTGLLKVMGISVGTGTAVPEYQDLSFMVTSNLGKGKISLFGLAGLSSIDLLYSKEDSAERENFYSSRGFDVYDKNYMGTTGLKYFTRLSQKTYVNLIVSANIAQNKAIVDTVLNNPFSTKLFSVSKYKEWNYIASLTVNSKINANLSTRFGAGIKSMNYLLQDSTYYSDYGTFFHQWDDKGNTQLINAFGEFTYRFSNELSVNAGVHVMSLTLNKEITIEPRIALKFNPLPNHSFSLGYGNHSKVLPMYIYFVRVDLSATTYLQPNKDLEMIKANHFVATWDWQVNRLTHVKIEGYYQHLYNAAIEEQISSFSMLNNNSFEFSLPDTLVNGGTGDNKGLELTVEQFMNKGFYYLFTASVFDSRYQGSDHKTRSTAFDGKYVVNGLLGKEFNLRSRKPSKKQYLIADLKLTAAGGRRYTPVDVQKSAIKGETVYNKKLAYSEKFKDYFRMDVRVAYRLDTKKLSHEIAFDVQNVTNHKNPLYMDYNPIEGKTEFVNQLTIFPMCQYRLIF